MGLQTVSWLGQGKVLHRDSPGLRARLQWNTGGDPTFGEVSHYPGAERMRAPDLPNVRLRARGRRR